MNLIPIKVECQAGYKLEEYPVCFYMGKIKFEITDIADRWYQAVATPDWPVANYFKVRTAGKNIYLLKHDQKIDQWFLITSDDPLNWISAN
jgi:hypothetical protein